MKGAILCQKCGRRMDEETGLCPKCLKPSCKVQIWYKQRAWVYRRGFSGKVFNFSTGFKFLKYIQGEIDRLGDGFDPHVFEAHAVKDRIFEEQWGRFIKEKQKLVEREKRSPEYVRVLESYNRAHYKHLHSKDVRDIKKATIKNLHDMIIAKSKTTKNIMDGLRVFFHWLHDAGIIDEVPVFPVVEVDDLDVMPALDLATQKAQIDLIPMPHRDVYLFESETGLRPGEVCALRIDHIDLVNRVMLVARTFSGTHDRGKTKQKRQAFLPLSELACEIAGRHMQGKLPGAYLFVNPVTGRHYTRRYLGDTWNKYSTIDIRHYDATRRSFCTQLVDAGINVLHAKDLMRHSTLKMTERYYTGNVNILRNALDKRTAQVIPISESEQKVNSDS
jgi:integrase